MHGWNQKKNFLVKIQYGTHMKTVDDGQKENEKFRVRQ